MTRMLIAGAGMAALAGAMLSSDLIGGFPAPPRPGEGHKRAREREELARLEREKAGPPDPPLFPAETRQQRRARERCEAKRARL